MCEWGGGGMWCVSECVWVRACVTGWMSVRYCSLVLMIIYSFFDIDYFYYSVAPILGIMRGLGTVCGMCMVVGSGLCVCVCVCFCVCRVVCRTGGGGVVVCLVGLGYLFYVTTDFIFVYQSYNLCIEYIYLCIDEKQLYF